jgi:hypothetical protein
MWPSKTIVFFVMSLAAIAAFGWDEFGPLGNARREHPEFFSKDAVHSVELDGVRYYVFTGDSKAVKGVSDAELYREAALNARANLLRHVTGGAKRVRAEVSGIVTAYQFADGRSRRVVCLVPVESVTVTEATAYSGTDGVRRYGADAICSHKPTRTGTV